MSHKSTRRSASIIAFAIALGGAQAWAQAGADEAARANLLARADRVRLTGDHQLALELGLRAGSLRMTASLRAFIAREQIALGRLSEALDNALACVREGEREPRSANRDRALSWCREQGVRLREQVGTLVVLVPSPPPRALAVEVNGHPLNPAFWDNTYLLDPGPVRVVATAEGHLPWEGLAVVQANRVATVRVGLRPPRRRIRPVGPIVAGVGAALLAGGIVFWLVGDQVTEDLRTRCGSNVGCTGSEADSGRSTVGTYDVLANVGIWSGAAAIAAGGLLTLLLRDVERPAGALRVTASLVGAPGVGVTFSWQ